MPEAIIATGGAVGLPGGAGFGDAGPKL